MTTFQFFLGVNLIAICAALDVGLWLQNFSAGCFTYLLLGCWTPMILYLQDEMRTQDQDNAQRRWMRICLEIIRSERRNKVFP